MSPRLFINMVFHIYVFRSCSLSVGIIFYSKDWTLGSLTIFTTLCFRHCEATLCFRHCEAGDAPLVRLFHCLRRGEVEWCLGHVKEVVVICSYFSPVCSLDFTGHVSEKTTCPETARWPDKGRDIPPALSHVFRITRSLSLAENHEKVTPM